MIQNLGGIDTIRLDKKSFVFGSVALFVGLIIMPAVNIESIQLVKESIALLGNNDQPSIVWIDDDYCDECDNDGHKWGYDAFDNIQKGINHVKENGEVCVYNGTYYETIKINKSLKLRGNGTEGKKSTIINGEGNSEKYIIRITELNVVISNFIITNSLRGGIIIDISQFLEPIEPVKIIDCKITFTKRGIDLLENPNEQPDTLTNYFIIDHNEILYMDNYGIMLTESSYNKIFNNNIEFNGEEGIKLDRLSNNNEILNNNIEFNGYGGIFLYRSDDNVIFNNNIQFNNIGITILGSFNSDITYNNISLNNDTGIFMEVSTLGKNNTRIYNNNIYANSLLGLDYRCSELLELRNNFWGKKTGPWIFWSHWFFIIFIIKGKGLKGEIIRYSDGHVTCVPSQEFNRPP